MRLGWSLGLALVGGFAVACQDKAPDPPPAATAHDPQELAKLGALGYVDWSEPLSDNAALPSGVVRHERKRVHPGFNLYSSLPSRTAHLLDMDGNVVHTWTQPPGPTDPWHHVEMTEQGELFGLHTGPLEKLDWNSKVLWEAAISAHHDLAFSPDGRVHALGKRIKYMGQRRVPIIDNEIVELGAGGAIVQRVSFADVFPEAITPARLKTIEAWLSKVDLEAESDATMLGRTATPIDIFHANSLELLERDVPGLGRRGDALVSMRSLDAIAVIPLGEARAAWRWGPGALDRPHHASLLPDDTVSVFDNGWHRSASRVLRVTPEGRVTWQYPKQPGSSFYTQKRGGAQHLPNGNVLITESQRGRVFEIDPRGKIVWEFLNPEIDTETRRRARIYRMERLDGSWVAALLADRGEEGRDPGRVGTR